MSVIQANDPMVDKEGLPTQRFFNAWESLRREVALLSVRPVLKDGLSATFTYLPTGFRIDYSDASQETYVISSGQIVSKSDGTNSTEYLYNADGSIASITYS